ncbi:MAG: transporter substrate-binding domain-containing protein [Gemmatimonadetes bacterium]|nr:transporter substrate-binding domain-containing protein [Gemmatimonadota bacterium]
MKALIALIGLAFAAAATAVTPKETRQQIEEMYWMTEQYPPFNYTEDGQLKGITVDILMAMFEKAGVRLTREDLHVLPWARGYKTVVEQPGSVLFSTTYTVERLQQFKFVGPIIPTRVSVIAPKSRELKINGVEELNQLKIGTIRNDIGDQLLRSLGVDEEAIEPKPSAVSLVQMLDRGRLDAIAYAEDIAQYQFKLARIDPAKYESIYVLQQSHMGYAFHKETDSRVLEPLRKALDELRADGTVERIYTGYLNRASAEFSGGLK